MPLSTKQSRTVRIMNTLVECHSPGPYKPFFVLTTGAAGVINIAKPATKYRSVDDL